MSPYAKLLAGERVKLVFGVVPTQSSRVLNARAGETKLKAARTKAQSIGSEKLTCTACAQSCPCAPLAGVKDDTVGGVLSGGMVLKVEVKGAGNVSPPSSRLVAPVPTRTVYVVPRAMVPVLQRKEV